MNLAREEDHLFVWRTLLDAFPATACSLLPSLLSNYEDFRWKFLKLRLEILIYLKGTLNLNIYFSRIYGECETSHIQLINFITIS